MICGFDFQQLFLGGFSSAPINISPVSPLIVTGKDKVAHLGVVG